MTGVQTHAKIARPHFTETKNAGTQSRPTPPTLKAVDPARRGHDEPSAGFLGLPAELRNEIYEMVVVSNVPMCPWHKDGIALQAQLLQTCRQVNQEATPVLYRNTLKIELNGLFDFYQLWAWTRTLRPRTVASLRHVWFRSLQLAVVPCQDKTENTTDKFIVELSFLLDLRERRLVEIYTNDITGAGTYQHGLCVSEGEKHIRMSIQLDRLWAGASGPHGSAPTLQELGQIIGRLTSVFASFATPDEFADLLLQARSDGRSLYASEWGRERARAWKALLTKLDII